jgi:DNA-binding NarL/FixJ family response regulator
MRVENQHARPFVLGDDDEGQVDMIKVMLVEDHRLVRQGTRELLERESDICVVAEAGDGAEAIRLADTQRPDVILMDIAMPGLSGLEATRGIKVTHPTTAVLVLTAYDNDEYVSAFLEAGAAGYLLKEASAEELVHAIRAVHRGESVLHPSVARRVVLDLARRAISPSSEPASAHPVQLTDRELAVLRLAGRWMTNREIALQLSIDARAVETHLVNIFRRLGVGSRAEAVLYALKEGWLP